MARSLSALPGARGRFSTKRPTRVRRRKPCPVCDVGGDRLEVFPASPSVEPYGHPSSDKQQFPSTIPVFDLGVTGLGNHGTGLCFQPFGHTPLARIDRMIPELWFGFNLAAKRGMRVLSLNTACGVLDYLAQPAYKKLAIRKFVRGLVPGCGAT